jgi:hypothetical protein
MSRSRKAPLTQRQARKAAARAAELQGFRPIIGEMHAAGNRHTRRAWYSRRGQPGWKRKKALRGEYYGRKLEELIRSGAPLAWVHRERKIIRSLLA